jgi:hypothetical protein
MLDQFIALLVLFIVLFARYMLPYLIEWQRSYEEEQRSAGRPPTPSAPHPLPRIPVPSIPEGPPIPVMKPAMPLPLTHTTVRRRRHRWFQTFDRQEARRGMVVMMVLGPCRALEEPHEQ